MPELHVQNSAPQTWRGRVAPGPLDIVAGTIHGTGRDRYVASPREARTPAGWGTAGVLGAVAGGAAGTLAGAALRSPKLVGLGLAAGALSGMAVYPALKDSALGRNPRAAILGGWVGAGALAIGALQLGVIAGPAVAAAGAAGAVAGALGSARFADR
ncbi:MAG: hypothetical protein VKO64_09070 [Candidatus Sericytochromatia bacterium]|nr:hypothetical protein [Candidatus Sericytochromatia bacterium]